MWFLLVPFVPKEPCSRPGDPDIAPQSNVPRCLLSPTSNEMPNSQLCPDITGEFPNNDAEYDKYYAGAFWTGTPFEGGYSDQLPAGGKTGRFKASWANSIYGYNSDVLVDALYVLIIIKT